MAVFFPESKLIQIDPMNSVRVFTQNAELVKEKEKKKEREKKKPNHTKKHSF